jgi:RNA polymerase subunit RPABC4/transcription elongation factor Spt4
MPERIADSRCSLCTWVGTTDADRCPDCGHGLVAGGFLGLLVRYSIAPLF